MHYARQATALLLRRFEGSGGPGVSARRSLLALAAAGLITGCASNGPDPEESTVTLTIEQVIASRTPELMRIEGVQGVGQALCDSSPCIRVYILSDVVKSRLPDRLDGYVVSPVVTGVITTTRD